MPIRPNDKQRIARLRATLLDAGLEWNKHYILFDAGMYWGLQYIRPMTSAQFHLAEQALQAIMNN